MDTKDTSLNAAPSNSQVDHPQDVFIGLVLQKRYMLIEKFETKGQNGKLYIGVDTNHTNRQVFVKISDDLQMSQKEFTILNELTQAETNFPKLIGGGEFIMELQANPSDEEKVLK